MEIRQRQDTKVLLGDYELTPARRVFLMMPG